MDRVVKLAISVAFVLVSIAIVYGTLQAEDVFNESVAVPTAEVATSTPVVIDEMAAELAAAPFVAPDWMAELEQAPAREYELTGNDILYMVRAGSDPCRFMYSGNRVSTFAHTEMKLWFVAGVWETDLLATGEMGLYGPNGPHRFEIVGPSDQKIMSFDVARGAQVYATVTFPEVGLYYLYDRLTPLGAVGEIFARPVGQPGTATQTEWCRS